MAFRTKAQLLTLLQANQVLNDTIEEFVTGPLVAAVQVCTDALYPDGMELRGIENSQRALLTSLQRAAAALSAAGRNCFNGVSPELGFYTGNANPSNPLLNFASFYDLLITNAEEVKSRGITKASSWTAGGSNIGDPTVFYFDTDQNGYTLDITHAGTLTLECTKDQYNGAAEGNEEWTIKGSTIPSYTWDEGGPGDSGGGYSWVPGLGQKDFGSSQKFAQMGQAIIGSSPTQNSLLTNGAFESAWGSGTTDKIPGWVLNGSHANVTENTSTPIDGDSSPRCAAGGAVLYQLLPSNMATGVYYGYQGLIRTDDLGGSGTITGTATLVVKDDSTTHATLSITLGDLTPGTTAKMLTGGKSFYLPTSVGANLRIELTIPTLGGTGVTKTATFDNIALIPLTIVDGGRAVGVTNGLVAPRYRDRFTNVTTVANTGRLQYWWNRANNQRLPHNTNGDYWVDATRAPEIAVTYGGSNVADGGTIALGSVATGAHAVSIVITNSGNSILSVLVPTNDTNTNITSVTYDYTVALAVLPGSSKTVVVTVTDAGAGAFSTTIHAVNNDASEGTFDITISGTAT